MSGILRLESLTKGNTLKQGDKTPLKYRLFDVDGEKLNIAGKSAEVRLVYPDFLTIGYEKDGLTIAQDDTVTFTIDKLIPAKLYHVEIIVDGKFIFPSRADESKFTVDKSSLGTEANIIEIVGVDALVRKAVDLINEDPNLIIDEGKLVNDIIKNTGIGSIEEYYQQYSDVIKELSKNKDYHSLPEIAGARGGFDTLGERLNDTDKEIDGKTTKGEIEIQDLNKNKIRFDSTWFDNDFLTELSNGEINTTHLDSQSVLEEHIANRSITPDKTTFFADTGISGQKIVGVAFDNNLLINKGANKAVTYRFPIKANQKIRIKAKNNDRFRVGILNSENPYSYYPGSSNPSVTLNKILLNNDGLNEFTFTNDSLGKELYVYAKFSNDDIPVEDVVVSAENLFLKPASQFIIEASSLDHKISTTEVEDRAITPNKTDFYQKNEVESQVVGGDIFDNGDGTYSLRLGGKGVFIRKIKIAPFDYVRVKTDGTNNRFRMAVMNSDNAPSGIVDRIIVADDSVTEYSFYNDALGKEVYVYISLHSNYVPDVTFETYSFKMLTTEQPKNFELEISTIINNGGIKATKSEYPILFGVKMSNERKNEHPRPIGWLYYMNKEPYDIYYADGHPDKLEYLFTWNKDVTYGGDKTPMNYSPFITKDGDIIFVFRGEQVDDYTTKPSFNPEARQNPIIYPSDDYNNPVVVNFGDKIKPTNWLMNCGADYIYDKDIFMFAEYTRTVHKKSYTWKVTKPFTDPDNWRRVQEFDLSGEYIDGMKHMHTVNYDPFSGAVYTSTGDDSTAAAIYVSKDYGETWDIEIDNSVYPNAEKYARVLNFIFTKDKVYWATDSFKRDMHFLFEVNRDADGYADFSSIKELAELPEKQATYILCLTENPNGLLILDRYDNKSSKPMSVYFWSFETQSLHTIHTLHPLDGEVTNVGFRPEATNFYQAINDKRIVSGFGYRPNENEGLGNKVDDRVYNLVMEVKETLI